MMKMSEIRAKLREEANRHKREALEGVKKLRAAMPVVSALHARVLKKHGLVGAPWAGQSGKVYASVSINVPSFKDAKLVAILEDAIDVLGEKGLRSSDYASMALREYVIENEHVKLEVNAHLEGEGSPLCRRVKVGEEVSVIPKYEFRCD